MVYAKVASGLELLRSKRQSLAKGWKLQANKTFIFPTGFGFAFGERSGLTLGGLLGRRKPGLQIANARFESGDDPIALGELLAEQLVFEKQLLVELASHAIPREVHTVSAALLYADLLAQRPGG